VIGSARAQVYRIARCLGLNHEDAEEVAQDVLLKLWQRGAAACTKGLVALVARRTIASFLRRELSGKRDRRRRLPLVFAEKEVARSEGDGRRWLEARRALLRTARDRGGDLTFRILRLRLEGTSYREIAGSLGRPMHDVANRLHRIKRTVGRRMGWPDATFTSS